MGRPGLPRTRVPHHLLAASLDTFGELARARLAPATFAETYPCFHWLVVNLPTFVKLSDEQPAALLSPEPSQAPRTHL